MSVVLSGWGRLFTIQFRAGPGHVPTYQALSKAGAVDFPQGDVTKIEAPSSYTYNRWDQIAMFQGSADRVTLPVMMRMQDSRSVLLFLSRLRCPLDIQVHFGDCEDPRDFDFGWKKILVFEDGLFTTYGTGDLMAMEGDEQGTIDEEAEISARDVYEILRMTFLEVAKDLVSEEIIAVSVCDNPTCGDCGSPSDGCSVVMAVSDPATSSPGVLPQVIATADGYATSLERWITTFAIGEHASDATCVGKYLVVISEDGEDIHYAETADILNEEETWTAINTGFVVGSGPTAIWSDGPNDTWMVGLNGYIYHTSDPTSGVTVQDAGAATTENLLDVSGWNNEIVVAVGAANAFVYTLDGATWTAGTGPDVAAPDLISVALRSEKEWWVGTDDGALYVTIDYGEHWTEITGLKGTPTQVDVIVWASDTVGFVATRHAGPAGQVQRTISGGNTWYIMPETEGATIPANDYINALAVCEREVNVLFIGGLSDGAVDGFLAKATDF